MNDPIDWAKVRALIEKSERHSSARFGEEPLSLDEWRYLARAKGQDHLRYEMALAKATGIP